MARRILVIQTAFLGDLVLTTPLLIALRERFRDAYIAVLAIPTTAAILEGLPELDRILVHDKRSGIGELFRILRTVRSEKFDTVLSPHRSTRSTLITLYSGASLRVGYKENELSFFYNRRIKRPMQLHEAERISALMEPWGGYSGDIKPHLVVTDAELAAARALIGAGEYALVAPGSAWATKQWPDEYYAQIISFLVGRGYRVALIGGPGDRATAARVLAHCPKLPADLVGRTTLREMAALIAGAGLLVCNDSAPVHVAAAFDTPTIALYGPTTPEMGFAPLGKYSVALGVPGLNCRPCSEHGGEACPRGHFACMVQMTPDRVIDSIQSIFQL